MSLLSAVVCLLVSSLLVLPTYEEAVLDIVVQPNDLTVVQGSSASFCCSVTPANASITWLLNGQPAVESRLHFHHNGSLFINQTQIQDSGFYQCEASIGNQTIISRRAKLSFAYLTQSFDRHPENKAVSLGSSTSFHCINSGSLPMADILWEKDGQTFTDGIITSTEISNTRTSSSLQLINVQKTEEGYYKCIATNRLLINRRVESSTAYLTVNAPDVSPHFTTLPLGIVAIPGQPVRLSCSADGNPTPLITWEDGAGLSVRNDSTIMVLMNGSLVFTQVTSGSIAVNSTYQCIASNRAGVIRSPPVSVGVAQWTGQFVLEPSPATAIAGLNVTLKCTPPQSLPKASVQWLKDFAPVQTRQNISILVSGDLWIGNVKESDEGGYRCAAENTVLHLSAVTREAKLTVHVRPQIVVKPPTIIAVFLGSLLRLNCSASGRPMPGIEWYLNGKPLIQGQDGNVTTNSEFLMIESLSLEGEGKYECVASNAAGSVSTEVTVDVQVPPVITTAPLDTTVSEGSTVTLRCAASGDPRPVVQWSGPMFDIYYGNELTLVNTNRTREGIYTCLATNVAGSATAIALVDVQYVPQIVFITTNITVIGGDEVNFTCLADADPMPTVTWYRSNSVVGDNSNNSATLHIPSAQPSDDGEYYCVAVNILGQTSSVRSLTVHVAPRILFPPSDVTLKIRATLTLQCQASGIPTPIHTWIKDNSVQYDSTGTLSIASDGTLTITDVSISHSGTYVCIVSNIVGSTNKSANVVIQGLSNSPRDLQAIAISSQEIELKWTPPLFTGNAALLTYVLRYRIVGRETWNIAFQLASLPSTVTLANLIPYTEYEVAVAAENSVGSSHFSNITIAITHQAAPAVPVVANATSISPNGVQIIWFPPQPINGILQFYELRYGKYGSAANTSILSVDSETSNATVYGLTPFTTYVFSLRASTGNESFLLWSNWSYPVAVKTQEGVPLEAPQNVSLTVLRSRACTLQWTAPNTDTVQGFIRGYRVYYRILEANGSVSIANAPPGQNRSVSYILSGLRPYTRYTISVAVYNSANDGPPGAQVSGQTTEDVPDVAPTLVSVMASGPQTVIVSFYPPPLKTHNGILRGYQIFYRHLSEFTFNKDIIYENGTVVLSQRNHTVFNLKAYSLYEINVNAFTSAGGSPASQSMILRTGEGIPSPPTSVQAISVSLTTVKLTWQLPDFVNGVLRYYTVYYHPVKLDGSSISSQDQSNETLITLTHLSPSTIYNISVTATTGYGEGGQSNSLSITTLSFPKTQPASAASTAVRRSTKIAAVSVTRVVTTPKMTSPTISTDSGDASTQRIIIIASSVLGVVLVIILIILCGVCCAGKGRKASRTFWPSLHHERKRNRYTVPHFDEEESEAGDSNWPLSSGDNFTFKKREEFVTFQDSYLPEHKQENDEDVKGSHEMLELGYDVSPIMHYEADTGFSSFKGTDSERPPSFPGPSPYSSQEILTADQLPSRYDDKMGFEEDTVDSGL